MASEFDEILKQIKELKAELEKFKRNDDVVNNSIPDIAIIVPYRDRQSQRSAFMKVMRAAILLRL